MNKQSPESFIKKADVLEQDEVDMVVGYLRQHGESIRDRAKYKTEAYLDFMADSEYVNDGILTGDEQSINRQIEAHVIKELPENYIDLQRRIARQRGLGDVEISDQERVELLSAAQSDQRASLEKWAEYVNGDDGQYPDWFKTYVWQSVTKLGDFDKEKDKFKKRDNTTVAPYPELNREALAYAYDGITKQLDGEEPDDQRLKQLVSNRHFAPLYVHAFLEANPDNTEVLDTIEGSWTKYYQTDDPRTARHLAESLQGHGTGWCTAGEEMAKNQLRGGDFYVFYSEDLEGN